MLRLECLTQDELDQVAGGQTVNVNVAVNRGYDAGFPGYGYGGYPGYGWGGGNYGPGGYGYFGHGRGRGHGYGHGHGHGDDDWD